MFRFQKKMFRFREKEGDDGIVASDVELQDSV
jgi:hypothetical protein